MMLNPLENMRAPAWIKRALFFAPSNYNIRPQTDVNRLVFIKRNGVYVLTEF